MRGIALLSCLPLPERPDLLKNKHFIIRTSFKPAFSRLYRVGPLNHRDLFAYFSVLCSCANKKNRFCKYAKPALYSHRTIRSGFSQIAAQPLKGQSVTGCAETGYLAYGNRGNKALMPELLAAVYI